MSSIFSNKLIFCQQLLLELDLNKCRLSRIYESNFEIVGDQLHKPILIEKSGIKNNICNSNRIDVEIKNKFFEENQYLSISMYRKRDLPRLTIANKLSIDTGVELFVELNSAFKELTNELVGGKEVENSYTTQYNIKDIVSLNSPMGEKLINIAIQIYMSDYYLPIVIIKNMNESLKRYKDTFDFKNKLIAGPLLEEISENRFLYNSALSSINVTKLHLQNSKYNSFINMYGKGI